MIDRLLKLFRRKVSPNVAQAASTLLFTEEPSKARWQATRKATEALAANDKEKMWFWKEVRDEIDRRTGYKNRADTATRYLEGE